MGFVNVAKKTPLMPQPVPVVLSPPWSQSPQPHTSYALLASPQGKEVAAPDPTPGRVDESATAPPVTPAPDGQVLEYGGVPQEAPPASDVLPPAEETEACGVTDVMVDTSPLEVELSLEGKTNEEKAKLVEEFVAKRQALLEYQGALQKRLDAAEERSGRATSSKLVMDEQLKSLQADLEAVEVDRQSADAASADKHKELKAARTQLESLLKEKETSQERMSVLSDEVTVQKAKLESLRCQLRQTNEQCDAVRQGVEERKHGAAQSHEETKKIVSDAVCEFLTGAVSQLTQLFDTLDVASAAPTLSSAGGATAQHE
eukprot:TRINITY_DN4271_c0_g1_i2.p1 TRINITY_DN4271_c0_g1~~TRINITY_DN4271_c0_g1_i2.p1  ORF type:complete len:316 (-),score=101.43 TRINITY_DN4271_c0_g1_i2:75-1022(-)